MEVLNRELEAQGEQLLQSRMREKQSCVTSCDGSSFQKAKGRVYRVRGGVLEAL